MTPLQKMARAIIKTGLPSRDFAINPICAEEMTVAVPMARAALEALREPSEGMLAAAEDLPLHSTEPEAWPAYHRDVWQAMITAALDEQAG
jgi:hypothetical protein